MIREESGMTLIEVILALAIGSILILGFGRVVRGALDVWYHSRARQELIYQGNFAMERITNAVTKTERLLVPLADNTGTGQDESLRDVLAVTLDPSLDRDNDGFADADNDKDGNVDEDIPPDNTNDGAPGVVDIDDDNDGITDEANSRDNDEDGSVAEDWINSTDDDGDGSTDEDIPRRNDQFDAGASTYDNDDDELESEDWLDAVVYFVTADGTALMERLPNLNPVNGNDYTERTIANADTIIFTVDRLAFTSGDRAVLLDITLSLDDDQGGTVNLQSKVRVGGGG